MGSSAVVRRGEEQKVVVVEKDVIMNFGDFESFPKLGRIRVPKRGRIYYNWRLTQTATAAEKKQESTVNVEGKTAAADEEERETPVEEAQHKEADGVEEKTGESSDAAPEKQSSIDYVVEKAQETANTPVEEAQKSNDDDGEKKLAKELEDAGSDEKTAAAAAEKQSIDEYQEEVVDDDEESHKSSLENVGCVEEEIGGDMPTNLMNKTSSTQEAAEERGEEEDINDVDDEANYRYYEYEVLFGTIPTTLIIPITPPNSSPHHHHHQQQEQELEIESTEEPSSQDFIQTPPEEALEASESDGAAEMITTANQVEKETNAVSVPPNSTNGVEVEQPTTQETTHQPQASDDERETSGSEGGGEKMTLQVQKVEDVKLREEEEVISFQGNNYDQHFPKIEFNARITKRERRGQQYPR